MNSQIQELIDQSSTMSWEVDHAVTTVDAYALAELIVKEMLVLTYDEETRYYKMKEDHLAKAMENYRKVAKEYFALD